MSSISKQITQERILKALDKAGDYFHKKPEYHVAKTLMEIGLKSICGSDNPLTDEARLELTYQGFTDPAEALSRLSHYPAHKDINSFEALKEAWISSFDRTVDKYHARQNKIIAVQEKQGISGLELVVISLGDLTFKYHEQIDQLKTLNSDFKILEYEREQVAQNFVKAVQKYNMSLWVADDQENDWIPSTCDQVLDKSRQRALTRCSESKYYVNQKELKDRGMASIKSDLDSLHDKLYWEFHLVLANKSYPNIDSGTIWFCANLGDTKPSR